MHTDPEVRKTAQANTTHEGATPAVKRPRMVADLTKPLKVEVRPATDIVMHIEDLKMFELIDSVLPDGAQVVADSSRNIVHIASDIFEQRNAAPKESIERSRLNLLINNAYLDAIRQLAAREHIARLRSMHDSAAKVKLFADPRFAEEARLLAENPWLHKFDLPISSEDRRQITTTVEALQKGVLPEAEIERYMGLLEHHAHSGSAEARLALGRLAVRNWIDRINVFHPRSALEKAAARAIEAHSLLDQLSRKLLMPEASRRDAFLHLIIKFGRADARLGFTFDGLIFRRDAIGRLLGRGFRVSYETAYDAEKTGVPFDTKAALSLANGGGAFEVISDLAVAALSAAARTSFLTPCHVFPQVALVGPACCELPIKRIVEITGSLARALCGAGVSSESIHELFTYALLGVCPECNKWCAGQAFLTLEIMATIGQGHVAFTGSSGGSERLLEGKCLHYSCESRTFLLFWCPDLDARMLSDLHSRGINIDPQAQRQRDRCWKPRR